VEDFLAGRVIDREIVAKAGSIGREAAQTSDDIHTPAKYRQALIGVMIERALAASAGIRPTAVAA
jgi:CO/xanthine dehydrogenase FAD-binding subunit